VNRGPSVGVYSAHHPRRRNILYISETEKSP
jgi:hypothetical protein